MYFTSKKQIPSYMKWIIFIYITGFVIAYFRILLIYIFLVATNRHGAKTVTWYDLYHYLDPFHRTLQGILWPLNPIVALFYTFSMSVGGYLAFVITYILFMRYILDETDGIYNAELSYDDEQKEKYLDKVAFFLYIIIATGFYFYFNNLYPNNMILNLTMSIFYPVVILVNIAPTILSYVFGIYYWFGIFLCIAGFAGMRKAQLTGRL